jgi:hypothetical protein
MFVTGIRNLDLVVALKKVTAYRRFSYVPVSRDQYSQFSATGLKFMVRWPPTILPDGVAGGVRTAIRRYQSLAGKLRARGNAVLDDNLKRTRRIERRLAAPQNAGVLAAGEPQHWSNDVGDFRPIGDEAEEMQDFPEIEALDIPEDLKEEFREAWDAFRRANNNMSVVFDDSDQKSLAVFGDAGPPVLRWLAKRGGLASWYDVMLAPHHGTQCLPGNFRTGADVCISQNGAKRGHLWYRHVNTHGNPGSCITTRSGNHHVYIPLSRYSR